MDSPIVTRLFKQLFRHPACQLRARPSRLKPPLDYGVRMQQRPYAVKTGRQREEKQNESKWQMRTNVMPADRADEFARYPYLTSDELKLRKTRPRKVKMLLRDFIDGAI